MINDTLIYGDKLIILSEFSKETAPTEIAICLRYLKEIIETSRNAHCYFDILQSELYNSINDTGFIFETLLKPSMHDIQLYSVDYFKNKLNEAIELIKSDNLSDAEISLNSVIDAALSSTYDEEIHKNIINNFLMCCTDLAYSDISFPADADMHEVTSIFCANINDCYAKRKNKYVIATIEYVAKHYADTDLSLEKTADALGVHFNYLSRVFKTNMDENFTSYVSKYRIEQAKILLMNPKLKINDISTMTGFGSQQNFSKVFKKYEMLTPGKYRELHSDK